MHAILTDGVSMSGKQTSEVELSSQRKTSSIGTNKVEYQPLTEKNLEGVYDLLKRNEPFYHAISLEYFRRGTLGDEAYDPYLTLVLPDP